MSGGERFKESMLKVVVYDGGYGGELFADRLEAELPVVEIIRVIDWKNEEKLLAHSKTARLAAEQTLYPYVGKVDLIILANYLISATSLSYFRKKYHSQKFIGLSLSPDRLRLDRATLILTTKNIARNLKFFRFTRRLGAKTICLNDWPLLIDDGELTDERLTHDLKAAMHHLKNFSPEQILLACGQFTELTNKFREIFGHNVRIVDGFSEAIEEARKTLKLKGARKKK